MNITSTDKKSRISIEHHVDEHGYYSFYIEATIDLGHSLFHAKNTDIHFTNTEKFAKELDAFILDRSVTPFLEGTYDSNLGLVGDANNVYLSIELGSAFMGEKTHKYALSGTLEIDQETLSHVAREFKLYAEQV